MQKECKKYDHLKINALVYHEHNLLWNMCVAHIIYQLGLIVMMFSLFQFGFSVISLLHVPDLIGEESWDKHNGL